MPDSTTNNTGTGTASSGKATHADFDAAFGPGGPYAGQTQYIGPQYADSRGTPNPSWGGNAGQGSSYGGGPAGGGGGGGWGGGGGGGGGGSYPYPAAPQRFFTTQDLEGGFNPAAFDPMNPAAGVPGLAGGYPTLAMLQYLTATEQARRQSALQATDFAMRAMQQPMNWLDWWRITRGAGRTLGGLPIPAFLGGTNTPTWRFPRVQLGGEEVALPSAQRWGEMAPTERAGLEGFYRSLGIPIEDAIYAMGAPTRGLAGATGMGPIAARR